MLPGSLSFPFRFESIFPMFACMFAWSQQDAASLPFLMAASFIFLKEP